MGGVALVLPSEQKYLSRDAALPNQKPMSGHNYHFFANLNAQQSKLHWRLSLKKKLKKLKKTRKNRVTGTSQIRPKETSEDSLTAHSQVGGFVPLKRRRDYFVTRLGRDAGDIYSLNGLITQIRLNLQRCLAHPPFFVIFFPQLLPSWVLINSADPTTPLQVLLLFSIFSDNFCLQNMDSLPILESRLKNHFFIFYFLLSVIVTAVNSVPVHFNFF